MSEPTQPEDSQFQIIIDRIKNELDELQKEKGIFTKMNADREAGVVRIYSENSDVLKRTSSALSEMLELAYTTAEHHPYWAILYHAIEISKTVLDAWESNMSKSQLSELGWRTDEIKGALERVPDSHHED